MYLGIHAIIYSNFTGRCCVGAFDLKDTCYSLRKIKPELPEIRGSEDTFCITKRSCINVHYPTKNNSGKPVTLNENILGHYSSCFLYLSESLTLEAVCMYIYVYCCICG